MRTLKLVTAALLTVGLSSAACSAPPQKQAATDDPMFVVQPRDEPEMREAANQARDTFDVFLKAHDQNDGKNSNFLVKIGHPTPGGGTEFLWVTTDRYENDKFTGRLANVPVEIPDLKQGATMVFGLDEIEDWTFERDGKQYGQFTSRVMLKHVRPEGKAAADEARANLSPSPLPPESR